MHIHLVPKQMVFHLLKGGRKKFNVKSAVVHMCSSSSLNCATPMRCDCEVRIISRCKFLVCAGQAEGQAPGHAEKEAVQAETDGTQVVKFSFISRLFTWYISSSELHSIRRKVDYCECVQTGTQTAERRKLVIWFCFPEVTCSLQSACYFVLFSLPLESSNPDPIGIGYFK